MYSHPVAPSDGTVVWSVVEGTTVNHLTALAGDGPRLSSSGAHGAGGSTLAALLLIILVLLAGIHDHSGVLLVLVDSPVEDVVVLEGLADEEITENLAQVRVVRLVIETERAGVVQVDGELVGEAAAENLGGSGHLLLHDAVILLLLRGCLQALPWQRAAAEVQHHVAQRLHVVTTGLLDTEVGVDTGVTGSTSEVLVLTVGDVEVGLGIPVLLGQTEIDHVDLVATLADTHEEIVGLDITVDERLGVDVLDSGYKLIGEQEHGLEGELAVAEVEQVLKTGTKKIDHHGVVVTLGTEPANKWDTDTAGKRLVDTGFILQLGMLCLDALKLDSNLLARNDVRSLVTSQHRFSRS